MGAQAVEGGVPLGIVQFQRDDHIDGAAALRVALLASGLDDVAAAVAQAPDDLRLDAAPLLRRVGIDDLHGLPPLIPARRHGAKTTRMQSSAFSLNMR
ncbi:hypothetical protein D3C71_1958240 [compost metagenome]